jgi:hypothetical protein
MAARKEKGKRFKTKPEPVLIQSPDPAADTTRP